MAGPIHYELFVRKTALCRWSLALANESRAHVLDAAESLMTEGRAVAVRVTKETLNLETGEYASTVLLTKGAEEPKSRHRAPPNAASPYCLSPSDLYAPQARKTLSRLLETWLTRNGVTAYELLHRPDLAASLDASGVELQHAIQKLSVPECQEEGSSVHDLVRHYQRLANQTIERLLTADREKRFPTLTARPLAEIVTELQGNPERLFLFGGALARHLKDLKGEHLKLDALLRLLDQAPSGGAGRGLVFSQVEAMLSDWLDQRPTLVRVLGPSLDQGGLLCALVRLMAPREVAALIRQDSRLALLVPPLDGPPVRLGQRLAAGDLPALSANLTQFITRELKSSRRLRPSDAAAEIEVLRAMAMMLTAASDHLLNPETLHDAFSDRSRILVTTEFVGSYVQGCAGPLEEAQSLTHLCENVTGVANKRSAARWLAACVGSLRFETGLRQPRVEGGLSPAQRLGTLAKLQRSVRVAGLSEADQNDVCGHLGRVGGMIEADAGLASGLARAKAPLAARLTALLHMATGETAPLGPAADMARAETIKIMRHPEARQALAEDPAGLHTLKPLFRAAGLAA